MKITPSQFDEIYQSIYDRDDTDEIANALVTRMIVDGLFEYCRDRDTEIVKMRDDIATRLAYVKMHPLAPYDAGRRIRMRRN